MNRAHKSLSLVLSFTAIIFVVYVATNYFAYVCSMWFYGLVYSGPEHAAMLKAQGPGFTPIVVCAFVLSVLIGIWYVWPVYSVFLHWDDAPPADLARKRLLNTPLTLSTLSFLGWFLVISGVVYNLWKQGTPLFSGSMGKTLLFAFTIQNFTVVFTYYFMEFMSRRFLIPILFLDGRLSECKGTLPLSVRSRFLIYFYSVGVFPAFLFYGFVITITDRSGLMEYRVPTLLLILLIVLLGAFLTHLIAVSYQAPLKQMKKATELISQGRYEVHIPIKSNDELGNLGEAINAMAVELKDKEFIMNTFGRMVDPKVRDYIISGNVELGGDLREATVLFADIKGFTSLSERMAPHNVVELLNRYFEKMTACVTRENGLVNALLGDAVMAVFGIPVALPSHAEAAARCALAMRAEMLSLNRELAADRLPILEIKIGINSGDVLAGNIGSRDRMKYTVIGDTVNTASRIEGLCNETGKDIMLSEDTVRRLGPDFHPVFIAEMPIRGKDTPVKAYSL